MKAAMVHDGTVERYALKRSQNGTATARERVPATLAKGGWHPLPGGRGSIWAERYFPKQVGSFASSFRARRVASSVRPAAHAALYEAISAVVSSPLTVVPIIAPATA